ncbi:MAG: helix-turn-helix domain-containing protein [Lachnospiraceae bacterium]|nr:helix-turn-helix domain-containing protein [Lachnospiraceae bacterium]
MNIIYSHWSKQVKKAMIDADLDTNDIADKFNWTRQYVSSIINGRTYQREAVRNISIYFNIPVPESEKGTLAKKKKVSENELCN